MISFQHPDSGVPMYIVDLGGSFERVRFACGVDSNAEDYQFCDEDISDASADAIDLTRKLKEASTEQEAARIARRQGYEAEII